MPLQGQIETFGISEIFQLISHQDKTGTLEISSSEFGAKLRFLDGNLVEAWSDKRTPAELIGALLVRAGLITPVQLGHALDMQRQNLRRIGDILIRIGALRISEFREMLLLQHRETVYRVLQLQRGSFRFLPEPVEIEEGVSAPMELDTLLMEGFRQIDEWPKVRAKVPSDRTVYTRVKEALVPGDLTSEEARVLPMIDGTHTVRELIDLSRLGEFNAWQAIANLFERGLLTPVRATRRTPPEPKTVQSRRMLDALVAAGVLGVAALLWLLSASLGVESSVGNLHSAVTGAREEAAQVVRRASDWRETVPSSWPHLEVVRR